MERTCMKFLNEWLIDPFRMPLVIRGARQVGKTWIVQRFAELQKKHLIEINLEDNPEYASFFSSNDPVKILNRIADAFSIEIDPNECLLFIDEIQHVPEIFAKLRWFKEKMPELPVIAAGSLLEIVLRETLMSMPVGRVSFMYLEPFSFEEFLLAIGKEGLVKFIRSYTWDDEVPSFFHDELMGYVRQYTLVGGMPMAVAVWKETSSLSKVSQKHHDILNTYRIDFSKYAQNINPKLLNDVINSVPYQLGKKFVYSAVNKEEESRDIKEAFNRLCEALVCHKVRATAGNGIPLGGKIRPNYFKATFIDVGLCSAILGLVLEYAGFIDSLDLVNKGDIAEQVVGQLLRTIEPLYKEPELFYWLRTKTGSTAEIDYVIQDKSKVLPIEVKAGTTGTLKSLHFFMWLKRDHVSRAVRVNSAAPLKSDVSVKTTEGNLVNYQLYSIPFYMVGQLHRLLTE